MTFKKLQELSTPHFYAISIDQFLSKILRNIFRKVSAFGAILSFLFSFNALPLYFGKADSLFFLFAFFYLVFAFLEFFYRSMKSEGLYVMINEDVFTHTKNLEYTLSQLLFFIDGIDLTRSLFETKIGFKILERAGITKEESKDFIYLNRTPIMASSLNFGESMNLSQFISDLYDADKYLQSFLATNSIDKEEFLGSVDWVSKMENEKLREERFWGRENLGKIPSIGKSWAFGIAYDLSIFGLSFQPSIKVSSLDIGNGYRDKEVSNLEGILEKSEGANALIIDDDEMVARDIISRLLKKIKLGISLPSIEHKDIIELDTNFLLASFKNKTELEAEILKILNQSISAGNIILYIRDFSNLIVSLKTSGINFISLISPSLSSGNINIIAHTTKVDFHFFIETSGELLQKFERIIPDSLGVIATVSALLEQVPIFEKQYKIIFSFSSIRAIANLADRFITYGEMPGKALNILLEISPWAVERNIVLLRERDVYFFIFEKTGIAVGPLKKNESEMITHLEDSLHQRVVGQDDAVSSIASAVRRSRSGVGNPKRPLASFLFIGPTGVGKTEVSKALAESFFGDENKMIRFDMSEFDGPEALPRLIGDFASNRGGILSNKVRDNPYSLLLLDEFEKASPDVLDLFLQVLDEGIFTDALGKQVGCRNLIIIATSNAGSSFIWEATKLKKDLNKEKDNIINKIIEERIFKPELLNRFDGVILFSPLLNTELQSVAKLGLEKLVKRLKEQSIEFVINDEVVNFLVEKGSDPQFGARSINRIIQDKIEDTIARKIVSGELKPGSKIELNVSDLL